MALTKKTAELPLVGGLDTKTDDKQIKLGKLLGAKNITYRRPGRINKREGFQSISTSVIDNAASISDGQALMTFNDELLAFDKENIYSWVEGSDGWKDKGDFQSLYLNSHPVSNGASRDYSNDAAFHPSGLECYVFVRETTGNNTLYYQINDTATKQIIVGPIAAGPVNNAINPRVITFGDQFVIYYYDSNVGRIYRGALGINNLTATITFDFITASPLTLTNQAVDSTYPAYDVIGINGAIYVAFNSLDGATPYITFNRYANAFAPNPNATARSGIYRMRFGQLIYDPAQNGPGLIFSEGPSTNSVRYEAYNAALNSVFSAGASVASGLVVSRVTAVSTGGNLSGTRRIDVFIDYTDPTPNRQYVAHYIIGLGMTKKWDKQQLLIAGGAFVYNNKAYCIVLGGPAVFSAQSTYFIIDSEQNVFGRFAAGIAGGPTVQSYNGSWAIRWVPRTNSISPTEYFSSQRVVTAFGDISGTIQTGITSFGVDFFEPEVSYANANIAKSLYVGGGMLFQYDGQSLVEDSFNWRPLINSMSFASGTTNAYKYVAVWEWVDNAGNIHRSAPSEPYSVNSNAPISAANPVGNIECYPLSLTYKTPANARSPIMCVLYRTKTNSEGYFKIPVTAANANDTSALWITPATDTTPDSLLTEPLYTTGQLPNDIPPPIGALAVYRNRLWALDSTNPLALYYSKVVDAFNAVEWNDDSVLYIDPSGGDVTAIASMDDKLLIFKESSIRFLSGNGPDVNGGNNDYQNTILITSDAGCINQRSVVNTPEGVIFKSRKGIYFINRGLQVSYIGAPVEEWNNYFITSGVLMADNNQVRLTLDGGTFLVYDYFVDNWTTFTPLYAIDSTIWNSKHAFIRDTGVVSIENPGSYLDDATGYPMEFTTGWISLGGIQGYQRLWKLTLLGAFKSPHNLQITMYYDYNNAPSETIIVTPLAPGVYGTGTYGTETPYGGVYNPYQYEIRPSRQKCMSVKISIKDISASTLEEGYELSNIRLSYGVIGGSNRLRNAQVFGG